MSVREGIEFETVLESDTAPLNDLTRMMLERAQDPLYARPNARRRVERAQRIGGRLAALASNCEESAIPIRPEVHAACEMLGLDPLYVANEGKLIAVVPADDADRVLASHAQPSAGTTTPQSSATSSPTIRAWSSCVRSSAASAS